MALQQVVPVSVLLKSDGVSTVFVFALGDLYQISSGSAVPYGSLGAVPSGVEPSNSSPPGFINIVQSTTIDLVGNITITLQQPIQPAGQIVNYVLNLLFDSGDVSSFPKPLPVIIISGAITANIGTTGGLALDSTLTGGTAKFELFDGTNILGTSAHPVRTDPTGTTVQPVSGTFFQATQPVSIAAPVDVSDRAARLLGHVTVDNASLAVTGTFFQATQPISGTVAVSNFPATQPVSGTVTVNQGTSPWVVSLASTTVTGSVAVTGTFFQATQPISGAISFTAPQHVINDASAAVIGHVITDTGSTVSVSNFPATQPVSGTVTANQGTSPWVVSLTSTAITGTVDVSDRAARLLGHVTVDNASLAVTGTFFQATQPVSIAGSVAVTGTFFQATQPVSGTVTANQGTSPWVVSLTSTTITGTVDVSDRAARLLGHVTVDNASLAVTGTFFQATQPVSIASPVAVTGTFFQATQPVSLTSTTITGTVAVTQSTSPWIVAGGGTAGVSGTAVLTVQGIAGGTALPISGAISFTAPQHVINDASAAVIGHVITDTGSTVSVSNFPATQPVSGTITANQGTSPWVVSLTSTTITGTVDVSDRAARLLGHVTIDNASLAVTGTFFQATQPVSGTVTVNQGTSPWVVTDNSAVTQGSTTAGEKGYLQMGAVTTAAPAYTTAQTSPFSLTLAGALRVDGSGVTQPISGAISFTSPQHVINDASAAVIGHVITDSGSTTVVTGSVAVTGTFFQATQPISGTVTVNQGTNPWVVSVTSTTITGNVTVVGTKTSNSAAPDGNNVGVLPAIANAVPPAYTEGDQVLTSTDLSGNTRVIEKKDNGRTVVTFLLDNIAGVTAEALASMTINKGGTVSSATSYTVTAGKTLRIQSWSLAVLSGNLSNTGRVRLRQAASLLVTSPVIANLFATSVSATGSMDTEQSFPDGLEVAGGQQVGISQLATSAANTTLSVMVVGFEY